MAKNSKILVTGGAGFIGSEVVKRLVKKKYQVRVVDDLSKSDVKRLPSGIEFIKGDLTDPRVTKKAFKGIDKCIHLAAKIGGIGYFHKYPATILSENNKIHSSVFEAAAQEKIDRVVYISSSMVFESTSKFPSRESDINKIPPPISGYGFSKLIGEWYCKTFKDEFGLNYSIVRPFNVYGINEKPEDDVGYAHVIPDLVKKIVSGQYPLELLGNGKQTRCFTHLSDIANGIILVMEHRNAVNEDFNLTTTEETEIIKLAEILWKLCKQEKSFKVKYVKGFKHDIKRRFASNSKARKLLGWKPKITLRKGLPEVVEWVRKNL